MEQKWEANFLAHFKAIPRPPTNPRDPGTAEETLQAMLPLETYEDEAVRAKRAELEEVELAAQNATATCKKSWRHMRSD